MSKHKNYELILNQKKPDNLKILKQKELDKQGLIIENNKILPQLDNFKFDFDIGFYNFFVNKIHIRRQAVLRKEYYEIFEEAYKSFYCLSGKMKRKTINRYLGAFTSIWRGNKKLGFKINGYDPSKRGNERHIPNEKNGFSHQITIRKVENVNIEDLELKNQSRLNLWK